MERRLELELMEEEQQVKAYAQANFEEAYGLFVRLFQETFGRMISQYILDLGCGPADISLRMAQAYSHCIIHGVDGSTAMLRYGQQRLEASPTKDRIELIQGILPNIFPPRKTYDVIITNSVLHHLSNPQVLWQTIKRFAAKGASVFVMDLKRPQTTQQARHFVEKYAADEPEILKRDFYNSFLAAFTMREILAQLKEADLEYLAVNEVSDRHITISGHFH